MFQILFTCILLIDICVGIHFIPGNSCGIRNPIKTVSYPPENLNDHQCTIVLNDPKNEIVEKLQLKEENYKVIYENISSCSVTCGNGIQTASLVCKHDNKIVDHKFCDFELNAVAQFSCKASVECETTSNITENSNVTSQIVTTPAPVVELSSYIREYLPFSPCSMSCGLGFKYRFVHCKNSTNGVQVSNSLCGLKPIEINVVDCNERECELTDGFIKTGIQVQTTINPEANFASRDISEISSEMECHNQCQHDDHCSLSVWQESTKLCNFKSGYVYQVTIDKDYSSSIIEYTCFRMNYGYNVDDTIGLVRNVENIQDCQLICLEDPACKYFAYYTKRSAIPNELKKNCYKFGDNPTPENKVGSVTGMKICYIKCRYFQRDLVHNNALSEVPSIFNDDGCHQHCQHYPGCMYAVLNKALKRCYLKKGLPNNVQDTAHSTSGLYTCSCLLMNRRLDGGGQVRIHYNIASGEHCQALCFLNPDCNFFNYISNRYGGVGERKQCKLYDKYSNEVSVTGVISAPKQCPKVCYKVDAWFETTIDNLGGASGHVHFFESCQSLCQHTPGCKYFVYNMQSLSCQYKGGEIVRINHGTLHFSGLAVCGCLEMDKTFTSSDVLETSISIERAEYCQTRCKFTENCKYFIYYTNRHSNASIRKNCILMSSIDSYSDEIGVVRGLKDC